MNNKSILYLYNPKAREGRAKMLWEEVCAQHAFLPKTPIDVTQVDLIDLLIKKKPRLVVIAGGDGTINAVCRAILTLPQKPLVSILPMGFGNALSYCLGVETIDKAISVLQKQEYTITVDLMKTTIGGHEQGVFNISAGFDARIVFHKQSYKYIGIGSYILSGLRSLFSHPEQEITFTIDHKVTLSAKASSLVIANCPVIGRNYVISPNAKMNDGLLDCTLFSTKYAYFANLRLGGFKHPLYTELGKVHFKASHVRIEGEPFVQVDGDPIVYKKSFEVEILPKQITFLRNTQEEINQYYLPYEKSFDKLRME